MFFRGEAGTSHTKLVGTFAEMKLLYIRWRQGQRELNDLKWYSVVVGLLLLLLVALSGSLHKDAWTAAAQLATLWLYCLTIHFNRGDKAFLRLHLKDSYREMYAEYFVFSLPFAVGVLFTGHWYYFFIYQGLVAIIPLVPSASFLGSQPRLRLISRFVGSSDFEYLSGIRKSVFLLLPQYLLALIFSWLYVVPLVLIWLMTITFSSFYFECEPLDVLRSSKKPAPRFLRAKIVSHLKYLLVLYVPVLVVNTLFHPGFWYVNIIFLLLQCSLLAFAITLKYSCYRPNEGLYRNRIVLSIVALGAVLPYFLPVPLLLTAVYYKKALRNLNQFL